MRAATVWQAMDQQPVRFLVSPWPWRALLYLLSGLAVGAPTLVVVTAVTATTSLAVAVVLDVVVVAAVVLAIGPLARLERRRVRLVDDHAVPDPPGRTRPREVGFVLLTATALCALDLVVLGVALGLPALCVVTAVAEPDTRAWFLVAVLVLAGAPYVVSAWAGARAVLVRTGLGPRGHELGADLAEVTPARRRLLDAFAAERARIERDLHDGAQQRLVAVTLSLGLARHSLDDHDPVAADLDHAREQLGLALADLRDLVCGIDPLAGRGLADALAEHAALHAVPIAVDVDLPRTLPADVASVAYFVVTEAMTNLARHSGAGAARVTGRHHADTLVVEVADDGVGGADPAAGSGLAGLAERIALVDGRLRLSSPPGGPTLLRMEVPVPLRVIVAEDAVLMREGLVGLLDRFGHEVVAAVGAADELVATVPRVAVDLVLTDVRMPPRHADDGLRAALELRARESALPVLVLSQYVEPDAAGELLDSGTGSGVGYLLKDRVGDVRGFVDALERVAAGGTVVDPEVVRRLLRRRRDPLDALSAREREVLALMAQGHANGEIATALTVTEAAVNKHVRGIFAKLDLPVDADGHRRVLAVLAFLRVAPGRDLAT